MKLIGIISTAVLSLTIAAPAYAQQDQHDQQEEQKAKPAQDEKKAQPEKPAKQAEKSQPDKNAKPEEKGAQQQDRNAKPEEKQAQQQDKNAKPEERNAQQRQQQVEPARQEQHGDGNRGGRIPDDRYQANFGREHTFRVTQGDYSNHRFQYGGYSFGFVDAWPSNWLYTEDLYVIDINGVYYLCNPMYPGVNIALSVTL
jgi:DNA mismatch repair ATPase MutL